MTGRPAIAAQLKREVLVEANHRCAICREPSFDVAHLEPWSKVKQHTFDNLISLCPNCHRRHHKGDIDSASLRMYKANLSILNGRYGDIETPRVGDVRGVPRTPKESNSRMQTST